MPSVSQAILTERFHALFPGVQLPDQERLFAFFKAAQLSCFVDKDAPLQAILKQVAEVPQQYMLCPPVSEHLSNDFRQNLGNLMQNMPLLPIVIYWNQASSDAERYIAQRITYLSHREMANESLDEGTLYWTALSLFLELCGDMENFRQDFITWHSKNLTRLEKAEHYANLALQFVPPLSTLLFYFEQTLPIFKMILPARLQALPPPRSLPALRLMAAGYLLYQGMRYQDGWIELTEEGYGTLHCLALVCSIYGLTTGLKHHVSQGTATMILFYVCQLLTSSVNQAAWLGWNLPPNALDQWSSRMPRYVLELTTGFANGLLHLLIRFTAMMLVLGPMEYLLRNAKPDKQAGFQAIGVLSVQFLMMFISTYLFDFHRWKHPQAAEEAGLLSIQKECQAPCQFNVKTPFLERVLGFFSSNQTTQFEVINEEKIFDCRLSIVPHNVSNSSVVCHNATLSCTSHLFFNETQSSQPSHHVQHPPLEETYCMVIPKNP